MFKQLGQVLTLIVVLGVLGTVAGCIICSIYLYKTVCGVIPKGLKREITGVVESEECYSTQNYRTPRVIQRPHLNSEFSCSEESDYSDNV